MKSNIRSRRRALPAGVAVVAGLAAASIAAAAGPPWMNSKLSPDERAPAGQGADPG